ncbi:MAG: hypothetical protein IJC10_03125 [Clostridia bacterium]|nr:hypothetical protein [Clostridia bacterium]
MFKKFVLIVLAGIITLSVCACGAKEESVSVKESDIYSEYKIKETKIADKQEFSAENVSVTLGEISYENVTTKINMNIKNDREETVTVSTADLSINGLMSTEAMILTLSAGEEKDSYIQISNQWLGEMNIETIKNIEFLIKVYDEQNNEIAKSEVLRIKTDAPWTYKQKYRDDGYKIYDHKGITISVLEMKKSALSNDTELVLYAQNNTDKAISVMCSDVSVNGTPVEPLFVMSIGAKKKAVDSMLFYESDLEQLKITDVKIIRASFKAFNENLETVFETDIIEVPVK